MIKAIIVGHGNYASSCKKTLEMIIGKTDNIKFVDFTADEGPEDVRGKIDAAYNELNSPSKTIICSDLAGGTPFNEAVKFLDSKGEKGVIGGSNIPLVLSLCENMNDYDDMDKFCSFLVKEAKEAIISFI